MEPSTWSRALLQTSAIPSQAHSKLQGNAFSAARSLDITLHMLIQEGKQTLGIHGLID